MLIAGAGVASAEPLTVAQAEPDPVTFGLLGPVGLVAVVLGVLGMALGALRQRRRAQATQQAPEPDVASIVEPALAEEQTRPSVESARRTPAA
nr:hypothetical protein [Amycolatopsis anabasis]